MKHRFGGVRGVVAAVGAVAMASSVGVGPASGQMQHDGVVSENPADYTPSLVAVDGQRRPEATALGVTGGAVYVGGRFGAINDNAGARVDREHLFALDRATGEVLGWAPQVNRRVWDLQVVGDSVYVGGDFTTVNGVRRTKIAKVDAVTGEVDAGFNARLRGGSVTDIELVNGRLVVAGAFGANLLALDPATGRDTGFIDLDIAGTYMNRKSRIENFAVNPQGTRLVAVGDFITVEGEAQGRVFMANLGAGGASLGDWEYPYFEDECASRSGRWRSYVQDVDFSPDGDYFAIVSAGFVAPAGTIGYAVCDAVARFETDVLAPSQPTWINYTGGDSLRSVAITGAAVYVQGHNRWLNNPEGRDSAGPGAVSARGGGAVDPVTGQALSWNPPHPSRIGGREMLAVDDGIWWANDSIKFRGEQHRGLQFTPLIGAKPTVLVVVASPGNPTAGDTEVLDRFRTLGFQPILADDNNVSPSDADGSEFVFVAQSVKHWRSAAQGLGATTVPLWVTDSRLFDDYGLTGQRLGTDYGDKGASAIRIVDPAHPVAAGHSGTVAYQAPGRTMSWGAPTESATTFAVFGNRVTGFAVAAGDPLATGSPAPACRLTMPVAGDAVTTFTPDAWEMFDAAVAWLNAGCPPAVEAAG